MAKAKLGLEIYALTTIPERADVGDGSGGERGTSETPDFPVTVSKLMTCERKYAFEPCCMLFASLIRGLLCIIRCRRHFVFCHGVGLFKRPAFFINVAKYILSDDYSTEQILNKSVYLVYKVFCIF